MQVVSKGLVIHGAAETHPHPTKLVTFSVSVPSAQSSTQSALQVGTIYKVLVVSSNKIPINFNKLDSLYLLGLFTE